MLESASVSQAYNIYLAKEDNVVSEQTFFAGVSAQALPPNSSLPNATLGLDYLLDGSDFYITSVSFPPSAQRVSVTIDVLSDIFVEGEEGFIAHSYPSSFQNSPHYLKPIGLHQDSLIVVSDIGLPIGE